MISIDNSPNDKCRLCGCYYTSICTIGNKSYWTCDLCDQNHKIVQTEQKTNKHPQWFVDGLNAINWNKIGINR